MGYLGRRIGLSQDSGDSNPGGADGAVGGGILDLFANGYFERTRRHLQCSWSTTIGGMEASGGVISDYVTPPGDIYRAHVFTSSGTFAVTNDTTDFGSTVDYLVVAGGGGGGQESGVQAAVVPVALEVVIQTFHHPIREVPLLCMLNHMQLYWCWWNRSTLQHAEWW